MIQSLPIVGSASDANSCEENQYSQISCNWSFDLPSLAHIFSRVVDHSKGNHHPFTHTSGGDTAQSRLLAASSSLLFVKYWNQFETHPGHASSSPQVCTKNTKCRQYVVASDISRQHSCMFRCPTKVGSWSCCFVYAHSSVFCNDCSHTSSSTSASRTPWHMIQGRWCHAHVLMVFEHIVFILSPMCSCLDIVHILFYGPPYRVSLCYPAGSILSATRLTV